jgi:hypothetical protein
VNVLLSGSHGLIGSALAVQLTAEGHGVVRLLRSTGSGDPGVDEAVTVPWDPRQGTVDRDALERHGPYDAVVHLAGAGIGDYRWNASRRQEILDSRVGPTRLLAAVTARLDPVPGVLVSASAIGYYGDRGDEVLTEDSAPGLGFLADVCRAWEEATAPAGDAMRVVHLRTGIVLARQGGALAKQLPLFRLGLGGRLGSGRQYMSWITLDDEVSAIRRAIDDDRLVGPVNAIAPSPVTNAGFSRALGRALRRPAVLTVPRPALTVALGSEMAHELLLASQRVLPTRLTAIGHTFTHPDIDRALVSVLAVGR